MRTTLTLLTLLILLVLALPAGGEFCLERPDREVTPRPGHWWRMRMVDGRRCWFYSTRNFDLSEYQWPADREEMDRGGVVREQRHYTPQELEDMRRDSDWTDHGRSR